MSVRNEIDRIQQNIANTYAVLSALGAETPTEATSDNLATTAGNVKVVRYDAQTLTDAQKTQARTNIGAASNSEFNQLSQTITDRLTNIEQKLDFSAFVTDDTVAYEKSVPANALPIAEVSKIGGMTRKSTNMFLGMYAMTPNVSVSDGVATQVVADTYPTFQLVLQAYNNDNYVKNIVMPFPVVTGGRQSIGFVKDDSFNTLVFGHNGQAQDIKCKTNIGHLVDGCTYIFSLEITNVTQGSFSWRKVQINKDSVAPYEPYFEGLGIAAVTEIKTIGTDLHYTYPIPQAVQTLNGYGWGVSESAYNYVDYENKQFVKCVEAVDLATLQWNFASPGYYFAYTDNLQNKIKIDPNNPPMVSGNYDAVKWSDAENLINVITMNGEGVVRIYTSTNNEQPSGMLYYELAEPIITDISDILSDDNYIEVEGGGTITMVNEHQMLVPNEITYQIKRVMA